VRTTDTPRLASGRFILQAQGRYRVIFIPVHRKESYLLAEKKLYLLLSHRLFRLNLEYKVLKRETAAVVGYPLVADSKQFVQVIAIA